MKLFSATEASKTWIHLRSYHYLLFISATKLHFVEYLLCAPGVRHIYLLESAIFSILITFNYNVRFCKKLTSCLCCTYCMSSTPLVFLVMARCPGMEERHLPQQTVLLPFTSSSSFSSLFISIFYIVSDCSSWHVGKGWHAEEKK